MAVPLQHQFARREILPSYFPNAQQRFVSGFVSPFKLAITGGNAVSIVADGDESVPGGVVSMTIDGRWRWIEATVVRAHPGGSAGVYDVYATASDNVIASSPDPFTDDTDYSFALQIVRSGTTPTIVPGAVEIFRLIGQVTWNGAAITATQALIGAHADVMDHAIRHAVGGADPLTPAAIGAATSLDLIAESSARSTEDALLASGLSTETAARVAALATVNADGWVTTNRILDAAVTLGKLATNSVDATKIVDGSVGTAEIAAAAVTLAKMAANSVNASSIVDGSVGTAELANASVTLAKMATDSVGSTQIVDGSVGTVELAALSVTAAKIANLAIGTAQLADASVTAAKIAAGAVAFSKLGTDAVASLLRQNLGIEVRMSGPLQSAVTGIVGVGGNGILTLLHNLGLPNPGNVVLIGGAYGNHINVPSQMGWAHIVEGQATNSCQIEFWNNGTQALNAFWRGFAVGWGF